MWFCVFSAFISLRDAENRPWGPKMVMSTVRRRKESINQAPSHTSSLRPTLQLALGTQPPIPPTHRERAQVRCTPRYPSSLIDRHIFFVCGRLGPPHHFPQCRDHSSNSQQPRIRPQSPFTHPAAPRGGKKVSKPIGKDTDFGALFRLPPESATLRGAVRCTLVQSNRAFHRHKNSLGDPSPHPISMRREGLCVANKKLI